MISCIHVGGQESVRGNSEFHLQDRGVSPENWKPLRKLASTHCNPEEHDLNSHLQGYLKFKITFAYLVICIEINVLKTAGIQI
jgi:hypothetical protein